MTSRRFSLAGAGAAGTGLGLALVRAGWTPIELASRRLSRAREAAARLGAGEALTLEAMADPGRPAPAEPLLLLLAVPDRHIAAVAAALARRPWPAGSVALHLSGSEEVSALAPLGAAGLALGGLHPLRSFVDPERDATGMAGTVFALEGEPAALALAEALAADLSARPFRLQPGARAAWHAGAAHACNHLVALLDQALDLMASAGLDREAARAALLPLMRGTLDNLQSHPPAAALTGPVARGDAAVVDRHLAALDALGPAAEDVGAAYRALARRAARLARERGLDETMVAAILERVTEGSDA